MMNMIFHRTLFNIPSHLILIYNLLFQYSSEYNRKNINNGPHGTWFVSNVLLEH